MKYIVPMIILIGFFTLLFVKGAEAQDLGKKAELVEKTVKDTDIKKNNLVIKKDKLDLAVEGLFLKEVQEMKRLEKEREERERIERERIEKERLERARLEKEKIERERLAKERLDKNLKEKESTPVMISSTSYGNTQNNKIAYLTFDDGPSKNTEKILNILKTHDVTATFFVSGNETDFGKNIYQRIVAEGHAIGNHTYSHKYSKIYKSKEAYLEDFFKMEQLLIDTIGYAPKLIRYPGGSNNTVSHKYGGKSIMNEIVNEMERRGYVHSDWNVDSKDAAQAKQSKTVIINSVLNATRGTGERIILFHDSQPKTTTVEALEEIIKDLKQKGYHFRPMTPETFSVQFTSAS